MARPAALCSRSQSAGHPWPVKSALVLNPSRERTKTDRFVYVLARMTWAIRERLAVRRYRHSAASSSENGRGLAHSLEG